MAVGSFHVYDYVRDSTKKPESQDSGGQVQSMQEELENVRTLTILRGIKPPKICLCDYYILQTHTSIIPR